MTRAKIRIVDNSLLRKKLDELYAKKSQIELVNYALLLAKHVLKMVGTEDCDYIVIEEGFELASLWLENKLEVKDIRKVGFKIHALAKIQENELLTTALRVVGQSISTAHMKEHAMVASDYAIKVVNILYPNEMSRASEERNWQIANINLINVEA